MVRKWEYGVHIGPGDYLEFIQKIDNYQGSNKMLIITGLGWDPRMSFSIRCIVDALKGKTLEINVHLIRYQPKSDFISPYKKYIDKNFEETKRIVETGQNTIDTIDIITRTDDDLYIGDRNLLLAYKEIDFSLYEWIILDVSSLPKSLYLPLLNFLITKFERDQTNVNLLVSVFQDSEFDKEITETPDDTRYLKGFKVKIEKYGYEKFPIIWIPVLEKNQESNLIELKKLINPHDIYPVFPFPSRNPRCDDDILLHYKDLIINSWQLDPMNIIYAGEDDPFDLYDSICFLKKHLESVFRYIGNPCIVLTILSSKLSSIGGVMAAYEHELEVAHSIGAHRPSNLNFLEKYFDINPSINDICNNMHLLWILGEPYHA
jgi:hypothetical protein